VPRHQLDANRQTALITAQYAWDKGAAYQNRRDAAQAERVNKPVQALPRLLLAHRTPRYALRPQSKNKIKTHRRRRQVHVALDNARNQRNQLAIVARQKICPTRLANVAR
jgi:hypothetical protein